FSLHDSDAARVNAYSGVSSRPTHKFLTARAVDCFSADCDLMIARSLAIAFALVVLCAVSAPAQEPDAVQPTGATPQTIDPDRPDVTNGTHIVDTGLLQVEFGGVFSRSNATVQNVGTPVTFRFGATDWLELRLGGDGFLHSTDLTGHQTGMGNTQLGAKLRLWSDPGGLPVVSILPT